MKSKIFFVIQSIIFLVIGIFIGIKIEIRTSAQFQPLRAPQSDFKLISPLVGFDVSEDQNFPEFTKLESEITDIIGKEKLQKNIQKAGLYVRTLDNGHWFGIDENIKFEPASLLKVPLMISYLKKAGTNPKILEEKVPYLGATPRTERGLIEEPTLLEVHKEYTIENLIDMMIIKSDNGAMDTLLDHLGLDYFTEVFSDFGIQFPSQRAYTISAKQYAVFFRRLRNATFLTREYSEKALNILGSVEFQDGIAAGVPKDITVAHKFGERGVRNNDQLVGVELHDCGIIYHPKNPYLLCIMTQGYDVKALESVISKISSLVFEKLSP